MALIYKQITLGAGNTALATARITGGTSNVCYELTVQNNAAHTMRIGDKTISATAGIQLAASGAANSIWKFGPIPMTLIDLTQVFVNGTQNDTLDIVYVV